MLKYAVRHYDDRLNLKVSPLLWFVLLYGVRHFFFVAASRLMPLEAAASPWIALQAQTLLMWCDLPALLVLVATGHRIPNALRAMHWIWHHGRGVLTFAYLLAIAGFAGLNWTLIETPGNADFLAAAMIVLTDAAIIVYLWCSKLVRDIFAELPDAVDSYGDQKIPLPVSSEHHLAQEIQRERQKTLLNIPVMSDLPMEAYPIASDALPQVGLQAAAVFEARNQLREAETVYRALLARWPDCADAWHAFGLLAYQAGQREHGLALVDEAMRLDGKSGLYRRNACEMYRRMGQLQEAIRYGQIACRLSPEDAEAWHYHGMALTNAERFQEAVAAYRKVIALDPKHTQCWNNLGVALQAAGNRSEAQKAYNQELTLHPAHVEARKNLQILLAGPK